MGIDEIVQSVLATTGKEREAWIRILRWMVLVQHNAEVLELMRKERNATQYSHKHGT